MKNFLRNLLPDTHPLRLAYHRYKAMLASVYHGFPSRDMKVIAITGTNGKTSTANFIAQILKHSGKKVGLLTTVNFMIDDLVEVNDTKQSTQGPWVLQKKIKEMKEAGCEYLILEATSHALVQHRLWGIPIDTAVFTNLTPDHANYHGSMEAYREAKGLLFRQLMESARKDSVPKTAVINMDDPSAEYYASFPCDQRLDFGLQKGAYRAIIKEERLEETEFVLKVPNGEASVCLKVLGKMNVSNALAASAVCLAHGLSMEDLVKGLETLSPVPGRIEMIHEGQNFAVIVDYAHTPDALTQVLALLRERAKKRLILVFGATGGGRDASKRPEMGAIAMQYVDQIILTDDDPYEEDSFRIIEDIFAGIKYGLSQLNSEATVHDFVKKIPDRAMAIDWALRFAEEGDVVLIAGKGAEQVQMRSYGAVPFDDRQVVRDWFRRARHIDFTPVSYDKTL